LTVIGSRRSTIVLYSDASSISSHRVRLVLAEKDIATQIVTLDKSQPHQELQQINPSGSLPTLLDRDLALYDAGVIIDYLDERYPHPPLMPVDPVSRARTRLALFRIQADWYSLVSDNPDVDNVSEDSASKLTESITAANDVFASMPFFFGEEYSILDATLAPLLWRLPACGILLSESAPAVAGYAKRMFARPGFAGSLSEAEKDMVQ